MSDFNYKQRKVDNKDRFDKNYEAWLRAIKKNKSNKGD